MPQERTLSLVGRAFEKRTTRGEEGRKGKLIERSLKKRWIGRIVVKSEE